MFSTLLVFSTSFDVSAIFDGEWDLAKIPENGNRHPSVLEQMLGIEFHAKKDSETIIGTIWYNNQKNTWTLKSVEDALIDKVEVEIEDEKVVLTSLKENGKMKYEMDMSATEDMLILTGKYEGEDFTMSFSSENSGTLTYGVDNYALDRHISPDTVPIPEYMLDQFENPTNIVEYFLLKYKKFLPVLYTAVAIIVAQVIIFKFLCAPEQPQKLTKRQRKALAAKKAEEEKKKQEEEAAAAKEKKTENNEEEEKKEGGEEEKKNEEEEKDEGKLEEDDDEYAKSLQ